MQILKSCILYAYIFPPSKNDGIFDEQRIEIIKKKKKLFDLKYISKKLICFLKRNYMILNTRIFSIKKKV